MINTLTMHEWKYTIPRGSIRTSHWIPLDWSVDPCSATTVKSDCRPVAPTQHNRSLQGGPIPMYVNVQASELSMAWPVRTLGRESYI